MTDGSAPGRGGALAGLRILDFSWSVPGPFASKMLMDLGAEVLAVDIAGRPEIFRSWPPMKDGESCAWREINTGKARTVWDRDDPDDLERLRHEADTADILIEQFRPGAMAGMGLGYEALSARNPALIYCSITGYGQSGPMRQRAGHDNNYLALAGVAAGLTSLGGHPALSALPWADIVGGSLQAVMEIQTALIDRARTGQGAHLDVAMAPFMRRLNVLCRPVAEQLSRDPDYGATMLDGGSFYGYYRTSDGRYLTVGGLEPKFVAGLMDALDRADLTSLALSSEPEDHKAVQKALADIIGAKPFVHWRAFFQGRDLCVEPVLTALEAEDISF